MSGLKRSCAVTGVLLLTLFMFLPQGTNAITASSQQKNVILQLTTTCENSDTKLAFNYAENIGDGRGITFGCIGFTTGTYDGNMLIKHYTKLNPNNTLAKYIPALDKIDKESHPNGLNGNTKGLENFIKDVKACTDPLFKQAQIDLLNELYWNPALNLANSIGVKNQLTLAFIYDMCVNHGEDGARSLVNKAKSKVGGTPKDGVNENTFLSALFDYRTTYIQQDWAGGVDRVNGFRKLLNANNLNLTPPFKFTVYGDTFTIDGNIGYDVNSSQNNSNNNSNQNNNKNNSNKNNSNNSKKDNDNKGNIKYQGNNYNKGNIKYQYNNYNKGNIKCSGYSINSKGTQLKGYELKYSCVPIYAKGR
jgi:chitosanase